MSAYSPPVNKIITIIRLIRPVNCLLAMVGVLVGAYMTWLVPEYYPAIFTGIATFLVCGAGNILNDVIDIDIDRINRPDRVLVRGDISPREATYWAIGLNLSAVLIALSVNYSVFSIALVAIILLLIYNLWAKKLVVLGNVIIALLAGLTFITGGAAIDLKMALIIPGPIIPALFAFLFHTIREIIKDIEDIEGDFRMGVKTLPQVIGVSKSLSLVLVIFLILVVLTYVPIIYDWFGLWYHIITVYIIDLPLFAFLIFLWGNPSPLMLKIGTLWLKIAMILGIVALLNI